MGLIVESFQIVAVRKKPGVGYQNDEKGIRMKPTQPTRNIHFWINNYGTLQRRTRLMEQNDVEVISEFNKGDIISVKGEYMSIKAYNLGTRQLICESLVTKLERQIVINMVARKVYILSDRIKKRLAGEEKTYKANKVLFEQELKDAIKARHRYNNTTRAGFNYINQFQVSR